MIQPDLSPLEAGVARQTEVPQTQLPQGLSDTQEGLPEFDQAAPPPASTEPPEQQQIAVAGEPSDNREPPVNQNEPPIGYKEPPVDQNMPPTGHKDIEPPVDKKELPVDEKEPPADQRDGKAAPAIPDDELADQACGGVEPEEGAASWEEGAAASLLMTLQLDPLEVIKPF